MVIQSSWSKITNFTGMHRKTRSAQIASLRPQWTAARFSRVETQYSALVAAVRRRARIAESYNDRLIGRTPNNWCVGDRPRQQLRIASRRFGVRSSSAETNNAKRSGEHLIARAVACVHMMRIRNTHSARARIVRKCEIGKSRVLRVVTFLHVATYGWFGRSIFRMAKW